jgi:hypothetical protein
MSETDDFFAMCGGVYYVVGEWGRIEIDPLEELTQMSGQIGELKRQLAEDYLASKAEIERLTDLKRTCQCSEDDQCMFARERDECRTLLREGIGFADMPESCFTPEIDARFVKWCNEAARAAGGE